MPSLQDTLNPPRRAAARAEHDRRAAGYEKPQKFQREGRDVFAWANAHMHPDLWQRLAAVRVGRQQAAQFYARHNLACSPELTAQEYRVVLAIATAANCSFDDAEQLLFA